MRKPETTIKSCKHFFSEEEKRKIAQAMSTATLAMEDLELEKKSVVSSFKDKIDRAELDARSAARKLRDGYEYKDAECEVIRDYERGVIDYIRTDNGDVVETRQMSPQEKQMRIEDAA